MNSFRQEGKVATANAKKSYTPPNGCDFPFSLDTSPACLYTRGKASRAKTRLAPPRLTCRTAAIAAAARAGSPKRFRSSCCSSARGISTFCENPRALLRRLLVLVTTMHSQEIQILEHTRNAAFRRRALLAFQKAGLERLRAPAIFPIHAPAEQP
eukprot:g70045.t1